MKNVLYLVLIFLFASCVTEKGATNYFVNKHPEKLAKLSATMFPVKETFKPGVPVIVRDTVKGDSIPCPNPVVDPTTGQFTPGKVKCPDSTHETVTIRDTTFIENSAVIAALQFDLKTELTKRVKSETKLEGLAKDYRRLFYIIGLLSLIVFVLVILIVRK